MCLCPLDTIWSSLCWKIRGRAWNRLTWVRLRLGILRPSLHDHGLSFLVAWGVGGWPDPIPWKFFFGGGGKGDHNLVLLHTLPTSSCGTCGCLRQVDSEPAQSPAAPVLDPVFPSPQHPCHEQGKPHLPQERVCFKAPISLTTVF